MMIKLIKILTVIIIVAHFGVMFIYSRIATPLVHFLRRAYNWIKYFIRKFNKFIFIVSSILSKFISLLISALTIYTVVASAEENPGSTLATSIVLLMAFSLAFLTIPDIIKTLKLKNSEPLDSIYRGYYVLISNRIIYSIFFMALTYTVAVIYYTKIFWNAHQQEEGIAYIYGNTIAFALPFFATVSYMLSQFITFNSIIKAGEFLDVYKLKTEVAKFTSTFFKPLSSYLWLIITLVLLASANYITREINIPINKGEFIKQDDIIKFFILVVSWGLFLDFIDKSNKEIENLKSLTKGE